MKKVFRYEIDGVGIFEASSKACPVGDPRRKNKPDVSWLPQEGRNHQGAKSFWKESGNKKYIESGLKAWQLSVVTGVLQEIEIKYDKLLVLYEDKFQVIGHINSNVDSFEEDT